MKNKKNSQPYILIRTVLTEKRPFMVLWTAPTRDIAETYEVQNSDEHKDYYKITYGYYRGYLVEKALCKSLKQNE